MLQRKITQTDIATTDISQLAQEVYWISFADTGDKRWQVALTSSKKNN